RIADVDLVNDIAEDARRDKRSADPVVGAYGEQTGMRDLVPIERGPDAAVDARLAADHRKAQRPKPGLEGHIAAGKLQRATELAAVIEVDLGRVSHADTDVEHEARAARGGERRCTAEVDQPPELARQIDLRNLHVERLAEGRLQIEIDPQQIVVGIVGGVEVVQREPQQVLFEVAYGESGKGRGHGRRNRAIELDPGIAAYYCDGFDQSGELARRRHSDDGVFQDLGSLIPAHVDVRRVELCYRQPAEIEAAYGEPGKGRGHRRWNRSIELDPGIAADERDRFDPSGEKLARRRHCDDSVLQARASLTPAPVDVRRIELRYRRRAEIDQRLGGEAECLTDGLVQELQRTRRIGLRRLEGVRELLGEVEQVVDAHVDKRDRRVEE